MKIHQLKRSKWLKNKQVRRGRWNATGTGNYSGRGLKGQKSRSGHSMKPFFEWGQTSIVQRLPKARGFTRYYKLVKEVAIINLGTLDADIRISDTMEITKALLQELGYIKSSTVFVKILSNGDYAKHLTFKDIDAFSAAAKVKMEKPGTVHSIARKAPKKAEKPLKKEKKSWTSKKIEEKKFVEKKIVEKKEIKKPESVKLIESKPEAPKKAPVEKKSVAKKSSPASKSAAPKKKAPTEKKPTSKKTK